jgi:hypothetical protein
MAAQKTPLQSIFVFVKKTVDFSFGLLEASHSMLMAR